MTYRELMIRTAHPHHIHFTACLDSETAADALFQRYNGAFTYFLVKHIRAAAIASAAKNSWARASSDLKNR